MSTFWIGSMVTESATFPVIVPVMAAAGVAGTKSASSSERTTSVDVAARRKSAEFIRIPPQGSAAGAAWSWVSADFRRLYRRTMRFRAIAPLIERKTFNRAMSRFSVTGARELVHDAANDDDASPCSTGRRGWKRCPKFRLRIPDLDV